MKDRYQRSLDRLHAQLSRGTKQAKVNGKTTDKYVPLEKKDVTRIKQEIVILENFLSGSTKSSRKNKVKSNVKENVEEKHNPYVIDIYSVKFGYVNKGAKKKAGSSKGKRAKMKKKKTLTFVRTVKAITGLILKYRDGKMGISPKNHVFKLRNTEIQGVR